MKSFFNLLTISFVSFSLFSCDPGRVIDFVNQTEAPAKIKIMINDKNTSQGLEEISKGDSIVFHLKPKSRENIYCGMGTWSGSEINRIAKGIKSIEIETEDIKTVYKSKSSITEILKNNREGFFWKTKIEIIVE